MAKVLDGSSLFAERNDALSAENGGVDQYNQLCALALAIAGHDLGRRLQLILGANDVLAANCGDADRTMLPEVDATVAVPK